MFKSEIRPSTINDLLAKAEGRNYEKYLAKLVLRRVRGFRDEPVTFDFPVTAIIGPNGGGKTTILGAAACAYKDVQPRRFFAKSGLYDQSMQDWSIEYEIVDRSLNSRDTVRRTASFRQSRWNRDAPDRNVIVFGVSRTVPANERTELLQCASSGFAVPDANVSTFSSTLSGAVSRILGKDVSQFRQLKVQEDGRVQLLTGVTADGSGYSEFHFGAGESSVIRMVLQIEEAPDQSLILIEEIENGLHPVATIRLVEYLIDTAKQKRIQVILTTHANEALLPLPSKAIWVAMNDRVFQGKLDIGSLRAITGQITKAVVVFVEDPFAKLWVEAMLRQHAIDLVEHVEVHAMEGDGTAVVVNKHHNRNPAIRTPSICITDGDSRQQTSAEDKVYSLPGGVPESYVFDSVIEKWDSIGGKLVVALLKDFDKAAEVKGLCQEVRRQNMDVHLLYTQLGERLGLVPATTVSGAFCTIWSQSHPEEAKQVVSYIRGAIPTT